MKVLPPPGPARTRALLGVLAVVALGAYALSRMGTGVVPAAPTTAARPPSNILTPRGPLPPSTGGPAAAPKGSAMPQALHFDRLEPVPESPAAARDPFRFGVRPAPPPPPAPPALPPPPPVARPSVPAVPTVPPITLTFIGRTVLPDQRVVASLSDGRNGFHALEGQIVDGRYRVVRIGEESLVIEYADGTGRVTLPLRGQVK
jgi:hypothetical protein